MEKQFYQSKRFWSGVGALVLALGLIFTGEQTLSATLPEVILAVVGVVQTILGLGTNDPVIVAGKTIKL